MKIRQETRCRKCSPKNRAGDYGHDERLNPSSPRRHTLGGDPMGSLLMKVLTPNLPNWLRQIEPEPKPNMSENIKGQINNAMDVRRLNATHKTPGASPGEKVSFKPKIVNPPITVTEVTKPDSGVTWEGGRKFNSGEQKSNILSPRRKTALSRRNLR